MQSLEKLVRGFARAVGMSNRIFLTSEVGVSLASLPDVGVSGPTKGMTAKLYFDESLRAKGQYALRATFEPIGFINDPDNAIPGIYPTGQTEVLTLVTDLSMGDIEKMESLMRTSASIEECVNSFLEQNIRFANGADVAKFHRVLESHSQFICRSEFTSLNGILFNRPTGPDAQPS